ncbi:MAG: hypothetical protein ACK5LT_02340 [Lachnospirales bacterium]
MNQVEHAFDILKNTLDLRPMYHWKESRVKGYIYMCVLAEYIYNAVSYDLKLCGANVSTDRFLSILQGVSIVKLDIKNEAKAYKFTEIKEEDKVIFKKMKVKINNPPKLNVV